MYEDNATKILFWVYISSKSEQVDFGRFSNFALYLNRYEFHEPTKFFFMNIPEKPRAITSPNFSTDSITVSQRMFDDIFIYEM